ncbi:MAG: fasciclin domain-containing protein [Parasphingopyxis sp.]|nr:fasciclin domain-containing protein [Sphingomonadales bacterium]
MKTGVVAAAAFVSQAAFAQDAAENEAADTTASETEAEATTTIVEAAMATAELSTLVSALRQAELVETLGGPGPYTVFAPTNDAFALLPAETLEALMEDAAREQLRQLISYHVVPGSYDARTLVSRVEGAGGEVTLQTVAGQPLTIQLVNDAILISDAAGGQAYVTTENLEQSNGMVHLINGLVIPDFEAPEAAAPAEPAAETTGTE